MLLLMMVIIYLVKSGSAPGAALKGGTGMKVSREKAAENRAAIVDAAARLFRRRGFDGVSVAEITKEAGLTHGGFYGHFASKDALAAEAFAHAFLRSLARLPDREADLADYFDSYLSQPHRDRRDGGCPMAACATEIGRQDDAVQAAFRDGIELFVDAVSERLPRTGATTKREKAERRARTIAIISAMVGGMALARATARSSPELSAEILASVRAQLDHLVAA
jgi:TetR/AcrR family transcriptional regulator, transcriptional repressor for nem operon